ncbi:hypothetical protein HAX54_034561, partial [Datura stramonium]|nr:hypothetical protein [Datura stramonium]
MTSKRARSTSKSVVASRRSKRTKTQVEETNDKPETPGYLDVLADQAGVIAENEVASSQKQQDDALEAKKASEVDKDDSSQEQTESEHVKDKTVILLLVLEEPNRQPRVMICSIWFVHNVLCARDVGKNISSDWLKFPANYEAFNAYPWGRESFKLAAEYLLRELKPNVKTINLYGFPWAFMVWVFEVIPYLRHQVKNFPEEVSSPCGGGYTPLDVGGAGDAGGVGDAGGAGGRYTPAAEEVRRQEDTPYRLGRSSVVGTSK